VALYQSDAVLAFPPGQVTVGRAAIREVYQALVATQPTFTSSGQRPALRNGDLALTTTRLPGGGATVEVARRRDCNFNGVTPETEGDISDRRDRGPGPGRGGALRG
jgi:hypothetical protein